MIEFVKDFECSVLFSLYSGSPLALFNKNTVIKTKDYFIHSPPKNSVDRNESTFVYTYSSVGSFLVYDLGKFYDIRSIKIHVYGSKLSIISALI